VSDIETAIIGFIQEFGVVEPGQLRVDTPLLDDDLLDSLAVYEVVMFLEQRYGIEVLDEEVVPENFGTVASLARLVESKR
jgi:acyl carrier protein